MIEKGLKWAQEATEKGFKYVLWDGSEAAKECPICHNHSADGDYYGGNCIWFSSAYLFHGMGMTNIDCACNGLLGGSSSYTALLLMPYKFSQKLVDNKLGAGKFKLIRKKNRASLGTEDLERGDIIVYYNHGIFWHVAVYIGDGRIIDCARQHGGVMERNWDLKYPCNAAIRYIGE